MEAEGIKPAPAADRRTLIRRLYLDLIGLPPAPDEVQAFLDDKSPDAVAKVVDRLLASPQYGERWARHWLDVVRYAETNGYERDGAKPNAWRYRDYVIDALNHDKPYDRFLTEQLAGDELEGSDAPAQIATTFLRLGTWDDEPAEPMVDRYDQLDDVLGTAATAFLGITLRCARCHDHKFEPFSQVDYYRMLAVFEPLKRPQNDRAELDRPVGTEAELAAYHASAGQGRRRVQPRPGSGSRGSSSPRSTGCSPRRRHSKNGKAARKRTSLPPIAVAAFRTEPSKRTPAQRILVKALRREARGRGPRDRARGSEGRASSPGRAARRHQGGPPRSFLAPTSGMRRGRRPPSPTSSSAATPTSRARPSSRGCPPCWPRKQPDRAQAHRQVDRSPALAGALADQPGKPAGGAGDRQPDLAVPLRPGARRVFERSGSDGRGTHSSRAARLAGLRVRWPRAGGSSRCTG